MALEREKSRPGARSRARGAGARCRSCSPSTSSPTSGPSRRMNRSRGTALRRWPRRPDPCASGLPRSRGACRLLLVSADGPAGGADMGLAHVGRGEIPRTSSRALEAAGDEIALHTHTWRIDEERQEWIADFADQAWAEHCLEMGLAAFKEAFGRPPRHHRFGDHFLTPALLAQACRARHRRGLHPRARLARHWPNGPLGPRALARAGYPTCARCRPAPIGQAPSGFPSPTRRTRCPPCSSRSTAAGPAPPPAPAAAARLAPLHLPPGLRADHSDSADDGADVAQRRLAGALGADGRQPRAPRAARGHALRHPQRGVAHLPAEDSALATAEPRRHALPSSRNRKATQPRAKLSRNARRRRWCEP